MLLNEKSLLLIWILSLFVGFSWLTVYAHTPGAEAHPEMRWPIESHLPNENAMPTLLVFLHPKCSCSEATLAELERLMPVIRNRIRVIVILAEIPPGPSKWFEHENEVVDRLAAEAIVVFKDRDGVEARRFDAQTSGQTLLYDQSHFLYFRGGLTPSRGHRGDSEGRTAILSYLAGPTQTRERPLQSRVFGCLLRKSSLTKNQVSP